MRSIISILFMFYCLGSSAQIGANRDAIGIQLGGSLLLFNDCCFESLVHSNPELDMGYRIALLNRHTSGDKFFHDFQVSYSRERIGYDKDRKGVVENQYLDYEAFHFAYYFGIRPLDNIPLKIFIGHNVGHIVHNFGDRVESELFGLNLKLEIPLHISNFYSIEPIVDFSWTYNKTTSYNNRIVFGLNFIRMI